MTGFTDTQMRQLRAKLDEKHVKQREAHGTTLHYIEGWHVIAEANRIFGFDNWDRRTLQNGCLWQGNADGAYVASYSAKVRICVRAGDVTVIRDGSGCGEGSAPTRGQAHDLALKAAETDATKRALATFGNTFGLALYDLNWTGVKRMKCDSEIKRTWTIRSQHGDAKTTFAKPSDMATALRKALSEARDIEALFALWEQNVDEIRAINRAFQKDSRPESKIASELVDHLKQCAVAIASPQPDQAKERSNGDAPSEAPAHELPKIDKSVLTIAEPKRIRSKEHLKFVARQACVVCGRKPSHAHHLRHAQPRGLSLKVSDEFTVPLCATHHDDLHRSGKEEAWWLRQGVEPLAVARELWDRSTARPRATAG